MSWLSDFAGTSRPGAPNLPPAPTLTAPQLPQYPGMTPEEQALLGQQQGYLQQLQQLVQQYQSNPLYQQMQAASQAGLTNYQNALSGNIPKNQMIEQQKALDWKNTVQQAALQGIRLSGDSPESAVSQSTAGNQIIQDFAKRYGALEQNYNLGQQQMGQQAYGLAGQQMGQNFYNQMAGYGQLGNQGMQLYQPYQQQQMGPWQVATQQAMSNSDIANQNAMNQWQQQMMQMGLNYNDALAGYQNRMGLIGAAGGAALGGMITGGNPYGMMMGSQMGSNMMTGGGGGGGMGFYPMSQITPQSGGYARVPSSAVNYRTGGTAPASYWMNNGGAR